MPSMLVPLQQFNADLNNQETKQQRIDFSFLLSEFQLFNKLTLPASRRTLAAMASRKKQLSRAEIHALKWLTVKHQI
jgi:hypothetical protein